MCLKNTNLLRVGDKGKMKGATICFPKRKEANVNYSLATFNKRLGNTCYMLLCFNCSFFDVKNIL